MNSKQIKETIEAIKKTLTIIASFLAFLVLLIEFYEKLRYQTLDKPRKKEIDIKEERKNK